MTQANLMFRNSRYYTQTSKTVVLDITLCCLKNVERIKQTAAYIILHSKKATKPNAKLAIDTLLYLPIFKMFRQNTNIVRN